MLLFYSMKCATHRRHTITNLTHGIHLHVAYYGNVWYPKIGFRVGACSATISNHNYTHFHCNTIFQFIGHCEPAPSDYFSQYATSADQLSSRWNYNQSQMAPQSPHMQYYDTTNMYSHHHQQSYRTQGDRLIWCTQRQCNTILFILNKNMYITAIILQWLQYYCNIIAIIAIIEILLQFAVVLFKKYLRVENHHMF